MSYAWIPLAACVNQTWSSSCASNACVQRHRTRPTGRSRRSHCILHATRTAWRICPAAAGRRCTPSSS
eukprot:5147824-Pleurochrysis_carterae.AAC.1